MQIIRINSFDRLRMGLRVSLSRTLSGAEPEWLRIRNPVRAREDMRGFSLIEALFYVVILSFALLAVMQTLLVVTKSYGALRNVQRIEQEAVISLERMMRGIRDANGIDDAGSVFGAHPGKLLLQSTTASGTPTTVEFSLNAGHLVLREGGITVGFLTSTTTNVSNLVFRKITTARSAGVKIEITMRSGTTTSARTENFYATAVLRDSY